MEGDNTPILRENDEASDEEEITYGEYLIMSAREGELDAVKECIE